MTTPILTQAICACSWHGELATAADCPACGLGFTHRVTKPRLAIIKAIERGEQPNIQPMARRWLIGRGLIKRAGPAPVPKTTGPRPRGRLKSGPYINTEVARAVLAAASRGGAR